MPGTQRPYRPYFYNFLTAFRVHHAFRSAANTSSSSSTAAAFAAQQHQQQQQSNPYSTSSASATASTSAPWPIPHKSTTAHTPLSPTSGVSAAFSPPPSAHHRHAHPSPASASAAAAAAANTNGPVNATPAAAGFNANSSTSNNNTNTPRTGRRGSDASSDSGGFRERGGSEAWFVGGKTPSGEERFYRLGMVRRERSGERASVDRMSL